MERGLSCGRAFIEGKFQIVFILMVLRKETRYAIPFCRIVVKLLTHEDD